MSAVLSSEAAPSVASFEAGQADDLDDEGDDPRDAIVRRWLAADSAPAIPKRGVCSVFELGESPMPQRRLWPSSASEAATDDSGRRFTQAERSDGAVRVIGGQYPSCRWTAERQEQEVARRARQRPPRPTKAAKTRGKKLRDLIGNIFDD